MRPALCTRLPILLATPVILLALLCAAVLIVGLKLSSPAPATVGPIPPELPGATAVLFPSSSGSMIHGWWVPGRTPGGGIVILIHGVRANRLQMIRRAHTLQEHAFSALLFDLQAHGESPGQRITFGKLEALDVEAAVGFARSRLPGEHIGIIGVSLGGASAVLATPPLTIDALILEAVYPDIDAALANRLRAGLGPLIGPIATPILAPLFKLLLPPIIGVTPAELRPIDRIGSVTAPLLIASGDQDLSTPITEAQDLFDHAPPPKHFWQVHGAAHVDLERVDPPAYWQSVLPFLTEHLQQRS
jgi:fermentation-respiration switch protein FrsA (DUF1100 family)